MDTALVLFLILLNGLFAMSEMALTASRKARLQVMVESGEGGAQAAMDLHDNPTKFLSTVQIGITGIGVLNGIVGDAAFSGPLSSWLKEQFGLNPHVTDITATALVVVLITLLTIGKVFLIDMAGLQGLLRVFSFLGLGAALLGLGYAYRRFGFDHKRTT